MFRKKIFILQICFWGNDFFCPYSSLSVALESRQHPAPDSLPTQPNPTLPGGKFMWYWHKIIIIFLCQSRFSCAAALPSWAPSAAAWTRTREQQRRLPPLPSSQSGGRAWVGSEEEGDPLRRKAITRACPQPSTRRRRPHREGTILKVFCLRKSFLLRCFGT